MLSGKKRMGCGTRSFRWKTSNQFKSKIKRKEPLQPETTPILAVRKLVNYKLLTDFVFVATMLLQADRVGHPMLKLPGKHMVVS